MLLRPTFLRTMAHVAKKAKVGEQVRAVTVGTDMKSATISLQKARPWYMTDAEGSNTAADNAVSLKELFEGKNVALFGVPAPFTGTCTNEHYPGYKMLADDFLKAGVDKIVCYAVSDPYAHYNWAKDLKNDFDKIEFMADADSSFVQAFDLEMDCTGVSLGVRSKRFSMFVKDGEVKVLNIVEADADKDAENLLGGIKNLKD